MGTENWLYAATCRPLLRSANDPKVHVAFNLVGLGLRAGPEPERYEPIDIPNDPAQSDARAEIASPWVIFTGQYDCWARVSVAGLRKEWQWRADIQTEPASPPEQTKAFVKRQSAALTKRARGRNLVSFDPRNNSAQAVPYETWTAHLNSLSQYPFPLPFALNLSAWCEIPSDLQDASAPDAPVVVIPDATFRGTALETSWEPDGDLDANRFVRFAYYKPGAKLKGDPPLFRLIVEYFARSPEDAVPANEVPFIEVGNDDFIKANQNARVNWRKELPTSIGRAFDLLELAIQKGELGQMSGTPDEKKKRLLLLAQERTDLGLKLFAYAPADASNNRADTFTSTAEVGWYLLAGGNLADARRRGYVSEFLEFAKSTFQASSVPLEVFMADLEEVRQSRGPDLANLGKLLGKDGSLPAADIQPAAEELNRFLTDEAVLADLFVRYWGHGLEKGAVKNEFGRKLSEVTGLNWLVPPAAVDPDLDPRIPPLANPHPSAQEQVDQAKKMEARKRLIEQRIEGRRRDLRTAQLTLADGLQRIQRGLRQWYGDGLAGTYWQLKDTGFTAQLKNTHSLVTALTATLQQYGKDFNKAHFNKDDVVTYQAFDQCNKGVLKELLDLWKTAEGAGRGVSEKPTAAPLPLTFALPLNRVTGSRENQGIIVFMRTVSGGKDGQPNYSGWMCLNVARLSSLPATAQPDWGEDAALRAVAPFCLNPLSFSDSANVEQRLVEYHSRPLRCHLVENGDTPSAVSSTDALPSHDEPEFHLAYHQLVALHNGWGKVPRLKYDPNTQFEFAMAPVHLAGWIHPNLRATGRHPAELANAAALTQRFGGKLDQYVQVRGPYLRTVPVGKPRFVEFKGAGLWPAETATGESSEGNAAIVHHLWKWPSFPVQVPLAQVRCLADDLPSENQSQVPTGPPPVYLLQKSTTSGSGQAATGGYPESIRLRLRPPAVEVENWQCWPHAAPLASRVSEVRAIGRSLLLTDPATPSDRNPAADYADDPAVERIEIVAKKVFDPVQGLVNQPELSIPMALTVNPVLTSDVWPHRQLQRATAKMLVIKWSDAANQKSGLQDSNDVELIVRPGEVWEVRAYNILAEHAVPCFAPGILPADIGSRKPRRIEDTVEIFRVEGALAPPTALDEKSLKKWRLAILPTAKEVWDATKLSGDPQTGALQVELVPRFGNQPHQPKLGLWPYVRLVRLELQPWRWNGLPQEGRHLFEWSTFEGQLVNAGQRSSAVADFERAEAFAFADREEFDALAYDKSVGFLKVTEENKDQPLLLYSEQGDASPWPRYYRATLTVYSRYQGLPGFAENNPFVQSLGGSEGAELSSYRRAITFGRICQALPVPKVKLVIPVFEPGPNPRDNSAHSVRPSFLVITEDRLLSPFHSLKAEVAIAKVSYANNKPKMADTLYEVGADPILSAKSRDRLEEVDPNHPVFLDGRAIGLTFEREARTPLFANAAFLFDSFDQLALDPDEKRIDYFLKASFRWELRGGTIEATEAVPLGVGERHLAGSDSKAEPRIYQSPPTGQWEVRLLGLFDTVREVQKPDAKVNLLRFCDSFRFKLEKDGPSFYYDSRPCKIEANVDGELVKHFTLFFVMWQNVPDFFDQNGGRLCCACYEILPGGTVKKAYEHPTLKSGSESGRPSLESEAGQFLLVMNSPLRPEKQTDSDYMWTNLFAEQFRPNASINETGEDALSMFVRCSPPIRRLGSPGHARPEQGVRLRAPAVGQRP